MVEPQWRSPPRSRDVGAAIAAVASGSPGVGRLPTATAQLSPERRRCASQQEYEELAVALDRHAARARALAEELACRRAGDDWRPLLAPLVTFQTSLLDMHHWVLDAISEVATRSVGQRGSPLGPKHEHTSVSSSSPFRQVAEASTSAPSQTHNARGLNISVVGPSSESEQKTETASRTLSDEVAASLFFGGSTKQSDRMELLHVVGSMLRRKRDKLLNDGNGHMMEKVREIEEDIARVELELVMRSPVDTPQKRRVEANTSLGDAIATDGKTPSQGSTATPQSQTPRPVRQMADRETSSSSRLMPVSGLGDLQCTDLWPHRRSRSPSPISRICKSELDFSDTPRPDLLCCQKDGPELHDEFDVIGEEPISKADRVTVVKKESHSTPQSDSELHEVSLDSLEVRHDGSSMQATLTDIVSPLPQESACDTTEELISETAPPSEKNELLIRQRDTTDAVLIGSARHVGDDIRLDCSSERRGRSARRCMAGRHSSSDQAEAQADVSPQIGAWWHDRPERPERPAWRWGGDMGNHHTVQHHALESSSSHSSDSPVLPSGSEMSYEETQMANGGSDGSPPVLQSRRSPLRSLPPPWAFQGDTSLVIPATSSASSVADSPVEPSAPTAKSAFRGKENVSPPPPMAPSHALSASPSAPATKPPPKAPPIMVDIVASLTRSSSTPGKRLPATSVGVSSSLFHKTPSPRPRSRQRTSPGSAPAGSLVLQPRSLLFGSPSPHRYIGGADTDPIDWMSPIRPIRPVRHCRDPQPDTDANDDEEQNEANQVSLPLPLPSALSDGDWRPSAGSPVRLAAATTGNQVGPPRISADSPARVNSSPAKFVGSPARLIGSPARLGLGNSPARTTTPVRPPYLRSPSAPSLVGSPASSCGARDSGGQRQRSVGVALGSGDTPRNLTDWRKSLQMAKRQDERPSHKKTPWR